MSKKSRYLVEDNRWVVFVFAVKNPWWALSYGVPIAILWVYLWLQSDMDVLQTTSGLFFGVCLWLSFEYLTHRYIYHYRPKTNSVLARFIRSFHIYHHNKPEDRGVITAGWGLAVFWQTLIGGLMYMTLPSISFCAATMLSLTLYHQYYEWIHYLVHQKEHNGGHLQYLQQFHLRHHKNWRVNFGQTTSFMDRLMGTYEPVSSESKISSEHIFSKLNRTIQYSGAEAQHD